MRRGELHEKCSRISRQIAYALSCFCLLVLLLLLLLLWLFHILFCTNVAFLSAENKNFWSKCSSFKSVCVEMRKHSVWCFGAVGTLNMFSEICMHTPVCDARNSMNYSICGLVISALTHVSTIFAHKTVFAIKIRNIPSFFFLIQSIWKLLFIMCVMYGCALLFFLGKKRDWMKNRTHVRQTD